MEREIAAAKAVISEELQHSGIVLRSVLLFGSRATGSHKSGSDFDFLVVVDRNLDFNAKWAIILRIKRRLARLGLPNDIIMKSEQQLQSEKDDVGRIAYYAFREGTPV